MLYHTHIQIIISKQTLFSGLRRPVPRRSRRGELGRVVGGRLRRRRHEAETENVLRLFQNFFF